MNMVYKDFDIRQLECVGSNNQRHYLKCPIPLSCGHYICKQCIPHNEFEIIKCKICDKINTTNLRFQEESKIAKHTLNIMLEFMLEDQLTNFTKVLLELKNNVNEAKERVNLQFDYVKEEVEIRIESLKIELDKLLEQFNKDLEIKRVNYTNKLEERNDEIEFGHERLKSLKTEIERNDNDDQSKSQSLDVLYNYDEILQNLTQLNENLKAFSIKVRFDASDFNIEESSVGEIKYFDQFLISLKNGVMFTKSFKYMPHDICKISENRLLISDYDTKMLYLYDENYELVKRLDNINGYEFAPYGITSNLKDKIFFTDDESHTVSSLDFELNLVNTVGSLGSNFNQFSDPDGISYHDGLVYVCDLKNKRIQVLDEQLEFQRYHRLKFKPWYIKVLDITACIRPFDDEAIYFFETIQFNEIQKYNGHNGYICTINDVFFCELSHKTKTLYCYNNDGSLNDTFQIMFSNSVKLSEYDAIGYFQKGFILSLVQDNQVFML